jgi:hypothetical protein
MARRAASVSRFDVGGRENTMVGARHAACYGEPSMTRDTHSKHASSATQESDPTKNSHFRARTGVRSGKDGEFTVKGYAEQWDVRKVG